MQCPICQKRKVAKGDTICRICRRFINEYILTGKIRRQTVPMVADVWLVMQKLGVSQEQAVRLLGGTP